MGGFYRARFGFRLWNPITWLFLIPLFLIDFAIHTFNGLINTVNDIFSLNNQEVSVNKPLKKNKDYEGED